MELCFLFLVLTTASGALNIEPVMPVEVLGEDPNQFLPITTLNCRITDFQGTLTARWRHNNDIFTEASTGKYVVTISLTESFNVTTLTINPVAYTDFGVYICEVKDDSSSWVNASTELILRTHLNASESSVTVYNNVSSIQFSCDMAGFVPPVSDLQWFRNGMMLQNTSDYTIFIEAGNRAALLPGSSQPGSSVLSVLVINEPQVEDSGEYQCRIVSLGISESVQFTVLTPSSPSMSESVILTVLTPSSPSMSESVQLIVLTPLQLSTTITSTLITAISTSTSSDTMPSAPSTDVHIPLYIVASCLSFIIIILVSIIIGLIVKIKCGCQCISKTLSSPLNGSHSDQRGVELQSPAVVNESDTITQHGIRSDFSTTHNEAYGVSSVSICTARNETYGVSSVPICTTHNEAYGVSSVPICTTRNEAYEFKSLVTTVPNSSEEMSSDINVTASETWTAVQDNDPDDEDDYI